VPVGGVLPAADPPATGAAASGGGTTQTAATKPAAGPSYTVKPGDFLFGIATKTGVALKDLLAVNGMTVASVILPGQTIQLPAGAVLADASLAPVTPASTASRATPEEAARAAKLQSLVAFLQAQVGKAYEFNAAGPDSYDCSGLVRAAYLQIGISLPHQSMLQAQKGRAIDWRAEPLQPGDLVFQYSAGKTYISHVGIALSKTTWIQAAGTGIPVKIGPLPSDDRIVAVRRIVG
jgi:cell wall-associated NlpC family hydrolase